MTYGASPAEWAHFDLALGLTADLLPVVSDPTVEISAQSKMKALGKTPSIVNGQGFAAGIPDWTQRTTVGKEIERWSKDGRLGICLQTRRVRALDIDVDHAQAQEIAMVFEACFDGATVERSRGGSMKILLPFTLEGDYPKRSFKTEHGLVEFLGNGQQFVAVGTHPSGARYEWAGGLPDAFPTMTPERFEEAWARIIERFALPDSAYEAGTRRRSEDFRATDPVAEHLIDAGLVLAEGRKGELYVDCPWKGGHSSDSGVTEACWLPAGSRGYERGHFKCLHASCAKRSDDEFRESLGIGTSSHFDRLPDPEPTATSAEVAAPPLARDGKGRIEAIVNNVMAALETPAWFGADIALDTFRDEVMFSPAGKGEWRPLTDDDLTLMRRRLDQYGFKPVGPELIRSSARAVARRHQFDSARLWLDGLEWDGTPRVETFLTDCFGADDTPYVRSVARYWWTGHAARILYPGCRCDMVPILVSEEGRYKSSILAAMVPSLDHFVEIDLEHKDADLSRKMRGALLGELAELRGLKGRSAEANKAWVTRRFEEWTPKYVEAAHRVMRRLMFVGTTNDDELLDDTTGERRWLPVRVGRHDRHRVRRDRDQLWAEAREIVKARMANGERLEEDAPEWEGAYEHGATGRVGFSVVDSWEEPIDRFLSSLDPASEDQASRRTAGECAQLLLCTMEEIMLGGLGLSAARYKRADEQRVGRILRTRNFLRVRRRVGSKQPVLWVGVHNRA